VSTLPASSTAAHSDTPAQEIPVSKRPLSIDASRHMGRLAVGFILRLAWPATSTIAHRDRDGQLTLVGALNPSTTLDDQASGAFPGASDVRTCPNSSTTTQNCEDGHDTPDTVSTLGRLLIVQALFPPVALSVSSS